jgi:hypothetical protein
VLALLRIEVRKIDVTPRGRTPLTHDLHWKPHSRYLVKSCPENFMPINHTLNSRLQRREVKLTFNQHVRGKRRFTLAG